MIRLRSEIHRRTAGKVTPGLIRITFIVSNETASVGIGERERACDDMAEQSQDVIPMIAYCDGAAALDWLSKAFGFEEQERWLDDAGVLTHGEMLAGRGVIMLATPTPDYEGPAEHRAHCSAAAAWSRAPWVIDGVLVYVADVEAHFEHAKEAGAKMLSGIEDGPGGRLYRAEDVEGHRWMFVERSS